MKYRSGRIPLLMKEGWPCHQEKGPRSEMARPGWSLTSYVAECVFETAEATTPSAPFKGGFASFSWCRSHPSFISYACPITFYWTQGLRFCRLPEVRVCGQEFSKEMIGRIQSIIDGEPEL